ncbi:MAG: hypothetical protein HY260_14395 [Chloroflexi bacterium]|nr:hypothetical protein [Chloroflexota bacterium]
MGEGTGESMYGGVICYRKGAAAGTGSNVRSRPPEAADAEALAALFAEFSIQADPSEFECLAPKPGKQKFHLFKPKLEPREKVAA